MAIQHTTLVLPPPADRITPAVARRWLHRTYPPLARLTLMAAYPDWVLSMRGTGLRRRERESMLDGLRIIALDVREITEACGKALATGRAVPIQVSTRQTNSRKIAREFRAVLKYEHLLPHRGARQILQRALAAQERLAKSQPRSRVNG